jgi:hypothetical protein
MQHNDLEGGSSGNLGPAIGFNLTSGPHSSIFFHVIHCFNIVFSQWGLLITAERQGRVHESGRPITYHLGAKIP